MHAAIAVTGERAIAITASGMQCLLQRVEHDVCASRAGDLAADDAAGEHVDHEGHLNPCQVDMQVEVADSQRIRPHGPELPIYFV